MNRKVGLWIDHNEAVIVSITGTLGEVKSIPSEIEKYVRFSDGAQKISAEEMSNRRVTNRLKKYYDEVISLVSDAESLLIVGPDEAKIEFKKRFERGKRNGRVINLETADNMTEPQIAAKVRGYYST
ncbi:MAG: hypothetical protein COW85_11970 [Ignavibacteria bacterium CG22_combo_CG10-13_8_21_14_all_37_15]|nr:hypothetical protein [Ignavibacteria bacterium]OIO13731.1 MAG: hypothetical protein AUJ54_15600 [Ignavibacteria bacterium CG1_02_37_35]PIP76865.1 MAG: hypothetical protein COW85_11970 [Ignavibacteria bacterium CG22_combo_CG10-13_8_21_14_all_37_15]PIS45178.1 MAG: hypothetical protein COT22_06575 [Ignavibacteria bacterium CG08_land_8_20_14_0_20_37_9]PIX94437.1 MAG: hypothetical protein COZ25_05630 [Ignavibacteria bacterium CG_4_10_14_3_um_filter_37_18]PJC57594.1 MAG: hypothetical protein CO02